MGTGISRVDVICGLPDDPHVPESVMTGMICPEGIVIKDIDITGKNDIYTLKCTINGKKQPKNTLTAEESRWVDTGVVSALGMAVRLNRSTIDKMAAVPVAKTLFD